LTSDFTLITTQPTSALHMIRKKIVFLGGTNAMPMMYAMELKDAGHEVLYFVEASQTDTLNRPESHYQQISYPYPDWIIEHRISSLMTIPLFPFFYASRISSIVKKKLNGNADIYFVNGFFVALAPLLKSESYKVFLSHGSDLDVWCNTDFADQLASTFANRSIYRYLPRYLSKLLIKQVVKTLFWGAGKCQRIVSFPKQFSVNGDLVLTKLAAKGCQVYERFDISSKPLLGQARGYKRQQGALEIFCGTRFLFSSFSEGNVEENKGNDSIIVGLGLFYKQYKNISVHFVEKGPDVQKAKQLCSEHGIDSVVVWHREMALPELLKLYKSADICFDQVGKHWIGAIGAYALWLGRPLIANVERAVKNGFWPKDHPVYQASTPNEICEHLLLLTREDVREEISEFSMLFAETYFSPTKLLMQLHLIDESTR
jgi:glycosyltransferase involved in cell wall biosynthesis